MIKWSWIEMSTDRIIDYIIIGILSMKVLLDLQSGDLILYIANNGHILLAIALLMVRGLIIAKLANKQE
jgi:hypothetical protein